MYKCEVDTDLKLHKIQSILKRKSYAMLQGFNLKVQDHLNIWFLSYCKYCMKMSAGLQQEFQGAHKRSHADARHRV